MSESCPSDQPGGASARRAQPRDAARGASLGLTPIGLHYLLTHYDIPDVDAAAWRLEIGGLVERTLSLRWTISVRDPAVEVAVTMECAGNGRAHVEPHVVSQPWLLEAVGTARWRGRRSRLCSRRPAFARARSRCCSPVSIAASRAGRSRHTSGACRSVRCWKGTHSSHTRSTAVPLPPQHGYPLRLVVPGWYGMTSVKWLSRITVLDEPFSGYQQSHSYRVRRDEDEPGEPLTMIAPRSLMIPPGIPEFLTRARVVEAGVCEIVGRAWSGASEIAAVDVSSDGGETWAAAELGESMLGRWAWRPWPSWRCRAGRVRALLSRARRRRQRAAARAAVESRRLREQRRPARRGDGHP